MKQALLSFSKEEGAFKDQMDKAGVSAEQPPEPSFINFGNLQIRGFEQAVRLFMALLLAASLLLYPSSSLQASLLQKAGQFEVFEQIPCSQYRDGYQDHLQEHAYFAWSSHFS
mmetsp:Transcript_18169/g.31072  ORF Transcript_18169/g.31072 Transcript_18169/m.31072 type:complete len:113 (+) Transcript_18169:1409-1747(+)